MLIHKVANGTTFQVDLYYTDRKHAMVKAGCDGHIVIKTVSGFQISIPFEEADIGALMDVITGLYAEIEGQRGCYANK